MSQDRIALVDGRRTPFCKAGGELAGAPAHELGRAALVGALDALGLPPARIDAVVAGCVAGPVEAPNVARQLGLEAGVPARSPGYTVNQACASGLRAVTDAAGLVARGEATIAAAVGTESMSGYPLLFAEGFKQTLTDASQSKSMFDKLKAFARLRPSHLKPVIALKEGLVDSFVGVNMGETAEAMAKIHDLPRHAQDRLSMESHQRVAQAWADGRFADEVVRYCPPPAFDELVSQDRGFRPRQSLEALGRLKPAFDPAYGTVTAGNSCMITDGAAAVVLMKEATARAEGLRPLAFVRAWHYVGLAPGLEGLMGPAYAIPGLLERAGVGLGDIGLFEINEAFATVILATRKALGSEAWCRANLGRGAVGSLDPERVNVDGGALALGHPLGASGTRMLLHLAKEMNRRGVGLGLAALCVHGGMGAAVLLEAA